MYLQKPIDDQSYTLEPTFNFAVIYKPNQFLLLQHLRRHATKPLKATTNKLQEFKPPLHKTHKKTKCEQDLLI